MDLHFNIVLPLPFCSAKKKRLVSDPCGRSSPIKVGYVVAICVNGLPATDPIASERLWRACRQGNGILGPFQQMKQWSKPHGAGWNGLSDPAIGVWPARPESSTPAPRSPPASCRLPPAAGQDIRSTDRRRRMKALEDKARKLKTRKVKNRQ
jgi:hypothetical protein